MQLNKKHFTHWQLIGAVFIGLMLAQFLGFLFISKVHAGTLGKTMIRTDRMLTSTPTTGTVCIAASAGAAGTEDSIKVTFPTGYTVSTTTSNWATNTTNLAWPSGALAMPTTGAAGFVGSSTANAASGQDVTWKISNITDTSTYCFNWTNTAGVSTQSSASTQNSATITTQTSAPATIDTGTAALGTVSNDQITVTATVNQTFSFAISASTDPLGTLSISSVTTSPTPRTITVNTNALNGWYTWAKDGTSSLHSTTASYDISSNCSAGAGTNSTLAAGTEGYNLGVTTTQTSGTGTINVETPFVGTSAGRGGGLCSSALQMLTDSNGTAGNAVLTLKNNAAISGATKAASDYTDTETYVGAGSF